MNSAPLITNGPEEMQKMSRR